MRSQRAKAFQSLARLGKITLPLRAKERRSLPMSLTAMTPATSLITRYSGARGPILQSRRRCVKKTRPKSATPTAGICAGDASLRASCQSMQLDRWARQRTQYLRPRLKQLSFSFRCTATMAPNRQAKRFPGVACVFVGSTDAAQRLSQMSRRGLLAISQRACHSQKRTGAL